MSMTPTKTLTPMTQFRAGRDKEIFLTETEDFNMIAPVGRKKKGYNGPQGLIKKPGSENWYIRWKKIQKSTGTPDLERARLILLEVQRHPLSGILESELLRRLWIASYAKV